MERTQKPLKEIVREGTRKPWKETAREGPEYSIAQESTWEERRQVLPTGGVHKVVEEEKRRVKASRRDGVTKKRGRKVEEKEKKRKRRGTKDFVRGAGKREDNEVVEEV